MKHDHIYAYSEEILVRIGEGELNVDNIIGSWEELFDNGMITEDLKGVINDLSNCQLKLDPESFEILMQYLKQNPLLKRLKLAVVCDSPQNIVFPMMAEEGESELKVKSFSTMEAAVQWIRF